MSQRTLLGSVHQHAVMPMIARDPHEPARAATPLELFFDLVAVVAVALAAERLHHALVEGVGFAAILSYVLVFFGIWWAWLNFTWFASSYDNDDIPFRISVLVIMTGALVLAAGVPSVFDERDFTLAVIGYVVMRIALVTQWLRVSRDDIARRRTALRYAAGVTACQFVWLTLLAFPDLWPITWLVAVPAEIVVPIWAVRAGQVSFHGEHIAERYGLFMIIVLGESVLAASLAIQAVIGEPITPMLVSVIIGSLLIVYAMWWIYFDRPEEHLLEALPTAFALSYLHLPIFASVAAVGAGLVVAIEEASGHAHLGWAAVGAAVGVPLVIYLLSLWLIYARLLRDKLHRLTTPIAALLVLGALLTPVPILVIGMILAGMVGIKAILRISQPDPPAIPG